MRTVYTDAATVGRSDPASPLLRGAREAVAAYLRQKTDIGVTAVLAWMSEALEPVVLRVLDDLARAGLGSIRGGAGGVTVTWRGSKARR